VQLRTARAAEPALERRRLDDAYEGWNVRAAGHCAPDLCGFTGFYIPVTASERALVALEWLTACALALMGATAQAHAIIVWSQPASGATLTKPTMSVELHFNSRIDHRRSRLQLIGPDGKSAALAIATGREPEVLAAAAGGLKSGSYRLRWQVMSLDGHITRGDIPFAIER
jgi:hypothetical protein